MGGGLCGGEACEEIGRVGILHGGGASPTLVTGSYIFCPAGRDPNRLNLEAGYYPQGGRDS